MIKTSCISHEKRATMVIVREDYLQITNGNHCAAALLNYFEHWTNNKLDNEEQKAAEQEIASKGGITLEDTDLWIFASAEKISVDMLDLYSATKIRAALEWLVDVGFIQRRNNPKYGWDRTWQYLLDTEFVQLAISVSDNSIYQKKQMEASEMMDGVVNSDKAIPKTSNRHKKDNNIDQSKRAVVDVPEAVKNLWEERINTMMDTTAETWLKKLVKSHGEQLTLDALTQLANAIEGGSKIKSPRAYVRKILDTWKEEGHGDIEISPPEKKIVEYYPPEAQFTLDMLRSS